MDITTNYSKSFVKKGRVLRKACASIKIEEHHLRKNPIFMRGRSKLGNVNEQILLIPSPQCIASFLSMLVHFPFTTSSNARSEAEAVLVFQTAIRISLEGSSRQFQRELRTFLFESPSVSRSLYFNEFHLGVSSQQRYTMNETNEQFNLRRIINGCIYLNDIMKKQVRILVIDRNDSLLTYCKSFYPFIKTITIDEYLNEHQSIPNNNNNHNNNNINNNHISQLRLQYQELLQSQYPSNNIDHDHNQDKDHEKTPQLSVAMPHSRTEYIYPSHLPEDEVLKQVKIGNIIIGKYLVFKHNPDQAEVEVISHPEKTPVVLITGRIAMNRAIHEDIVAVEILPDHLWPITHDEYHLVPDNNNDNDNDIGTAEKGDGHSDGSHKRQTTGSSEDNTTATTAPVRRRTPCGRIVRVLQRDVSSEIVATVPFRDNNTNAAEDKTNRAAAAAGGGDAVTETTSFAVDREEFVLINPVDRRLPKIRIRTRQWSLLQGQRVLVSIRGETAGGWPRDSKFPNGFLVRCLGKAGDWRIEVEALLIQHGIYPRPFSPAALACLPVIPSRSSKKETRKDLMNKEEEEDEDNVRDEGGGGGGGEEVDPRDSKWTIDASFMRGRRDYRESRLIFSDIDDAMSVHWLDQGTLELGVHIADVCAFLPEDCALDLEAQTLYLPHKRIDMLPGLLSSDVASLHGNRDRLAVSTIWHVKVSHKNGRPVKEVRVRVQLRLRSDVVSTSSN
eukprot:gene6263-12680_t